MDTQEALEIAKRVLRVNPKAFEHYVEKGKKRKIPFWPQYQDPHFLSKLAFVDIVHSLFSASVHNETIKNLVVMDDSLSHYVPLFHILFLNNRREHPLEILKELIHEYTHVVEFSPLKGRLDLRRLVGLFDREEYWEFVGAAAQRFSDELEEFRNQWRILMGTPSSVIGNGLPLQFPYFDCVYSFIDREHSSIRMHLAFTNPELLKAFYQILELDENPLKMIEETMGWEDIFSKELDKERINLYVNYLRDVSQLIEQSELKHLEIFSQHPELWNFVLLKPRVWPRETLIKPKFPFLETSYPRRE